MFQISKDSPLTTDFLGKCLAQFQTRDLPRLNRLRKYYDGNQKILSKKPTDTGKPCNKIVVNYCKQAVDNYLGYLTGKPITYENDDFKDVIDVLNYNDIRTEDCEILRQALIYGRSFEITYIDEDGQQRVKALDTRECIPVYDTTLNQELLYVVRCYREDLLDKSNENYIVEVYSANKMMRYKSSFGFASFSLIEEAPCYYDMCPVTVLSLNEDETSIFEQVISLQDAYNELLSSEVDDFDSFADAYMIIKGAIADDEQLKKMKEHRVLMLDADCDASYLTKNISDTQIKDMLENIDDKIHQIANVPNFYDEKFFSSSGIALRYKLVGFENTAAAIEANMRKAIQRRIELISGVLNIVSGEQTWRDVKITFNRNLPFDLAETVQVVNQLRGLVSQRTLLTLLPFVEDIDEELKAVEEEKKKQMEMYEFDHEEASEDDEE